MKFCVGKDKENGEILKNAVKLKIKQKKSEDYISVATVSDLIGVRPEKGKEVPSVLSSMSYYGWSCEDVRKNMRLRQTKEGWFLYFPKTVELPFGDSFEDRTINFEEIPEKEIDTYEIFPSDTVVPADKDHEVIIPDLAVRCCRVVSRKKNTTVTEYGFFHRWFHSRMPNSEGEMLEQELAIVEFRDGSVRQIRPDHIIFGWEE